MLVAPPHLDQQPLDRRKDTTYHNPQRREKVKAGLRTFRVRGAVGGDRINCTGDVAARTADMDVIKAILHSNVSDKRSVTHSRHHRLLPHYSIAMSRIHAYPMQASFPSHHAKVRPGIIRHAQ